MDTEMTPNSEWKLCPSVPEETAARTGLPRTVAQVLHNRGLTTRHDIDAFLKPRLHDPQLLPGMEAACYRLSRAVMAGETIGIFGDFDVDGVTATALVAQALSDLGARVVPYIPHRTIEGHGMNGPALQTLGEQGVSVLVTVDCGISSDKEVGLARTLGMDVIITDHHIPGSTLPPALSIIDPKLEASSYPFPNLSGGGLAFKLVQGLYNVLGRPWKPDLLELAALSTVADLVPVKDENRFLVKEGLKELRGTNRPGLEALYRCANIRRESIDVETISFIIAPRLNAAGRLDHADTTYRLLLTRSKEEAEALALQLEALNRQRQKLTEEAYTGVRDTVRGWGSLPGILLVSDHRLTPGIAGLVASRLVDEFSRPAVAMSVVNGVIRASARSIPEFDISAALSQCADLFTRHGGHRQAAGFEMPTENVSLLIERLGGVAKKDMEQVDLKPVLHIDAEVSLASLAGETFRWLKDLEPFGVENPAPRFLTRNLHPVEARLMGNQGHHLRLKLRESKVLWDATAFRQGDRWVPNTPSVDVVYTIGTKWRGGTETLALKVLDFRPSTG